MNLNKQELFTLEVGCAVLMFEARESNLTPLSKAEKIEELNELIKKLRKEREETND